MHLEKALLDRNDVAALLGVSLDTLKRYIHKGLLPDRVVMTRKKKGWLREDILKMLSDRKEYPGNGRPAKSNGRNRRRSTAAPT